MTAIALANGRLLRAQKNASIEAQVGDGMRCYLTTPGHCDCGTSLGLRRRAQAKAIDVAGEERKLARKGWSRAKIARAIGQKKADEADQLIEAERHAEQDLASWEGFIAGALAGGHASQIGLLLHMYDGALDAPFAIREKRVVRSGEAIRDVLLGMEEDALYVFRT